MKCRGKIIRLGIILLVLSIATCRPGCDDGEDSSIVALPEPYTELKEDLSSSIEDKSSTLPALHKKATRQRLPLEDFFYAFTDIDYRLP